MAKVSAIEKNNKRKRMSANQANARKELKKIAEDINRPFEERIEIVRSIKFVDAAIPQEDLDKYKMWEKLHFDILFVGDDWYNTPSWQEMEEKFKKVGVRVVYFPYTKNISSTLLNETLQKLRNS